jgi:hypothetical protein
MLPMMPCTKPDEMGAVDRKAQQATEASRQKKRLTLTGALPKLRWPK